MPRYQGHYEEKNLDPFTLENAYEALKYERGTIGYYDLPDSSLSLCAELKSSLLNSTVFFDTIAVVGIGGSSLGIKAIDRLLELQRLMLKKLSILKILILLVLRMNHHVLSLLKHFLLSYQNQVELLKHYQFLNI